MLRVFSAIVVLAVGCAAAGAQTPSYRIEAADCQRVNAVITYEIKTTKFTVTKWTAFLPEPPELPSQVRIKTKSEPAGKVIAEKSPLARPVRMIEMKVARPAPGATLALKLEVEATLRSRRLVPLRPNEKPPVVHPLTAAEEKFYLGPSVRADFETKAVRDWLDAKKLVVAKGASAIDLAGRILEVLRTDFEYRYDPMADRRASAVCVTKATDCGGLSYLFIAAMRANGVPARLLIGRTAESRKPGSSPADPEYDRPHARIEFYVGGVGWVPVDPTYAALDKGKRVAEFIGHDPGDMLVLHVETDLELPFPGRVHTADLMQLGPLFWADGRGTFDAAPGPSGWEVKVTPIEKK